jgi:hypothetical protein
MCHGFYYEEETTTGSNGDTMTPHSHTYLQTRFVFPLPVDVFFEQKIVGIECDVFFFSGNGKLCLEGTRT